MSDSPPAQNCTIWHNGRLVPGDEASVSVLDHGLLYGDGVFEGVRYYRHRPFRLQAHLERLERSARVLALSLPFDDVAITSAVAEVIAASGHPDGYLRLVVTRGIGPMGLDPVGCGPANFFIIASPLHLLGSDVYTQGARVMIAATRRLPLDGLDPRIKSLNYLNHILARLEANHAGVDEAILLNGQGRVAEGTADNLFIVRNGSLLTPPTTEGALAGITRGLVMELAMQLGVEIAETPLAPYDLYTADECFLTGTGAELVPVREIDGRPLTPCPGPFFSRIRRAYMDAVLEETSA